MEGIEGDFSRGGDCGLAAFGDEGFAAAMDVSIRYNILGTQS